MIEVKIKPLSVNEAWKGKRFKTKDYTQYEKALLLMLPAMKICEPPFKVTINFCFSNSASDLDNPLKPFLDILQKKYGINDKDIYSLEVNKFIVKKGEESICFSIHRILIKK